MEMSAKWAAAGGWAARTALGAELLHFSLLVHSAHALPYPSVSTAVPFLKGG